MKDVHEILVENRHSIFEESLRNRQRWDEIFVQN